MIKRIFDAIVGKPSHAGQQRRNFFTQTTSPSSARRFGARGGRSRPAEQTVPRRLSVFPTLHEINSARQPIGNRRHSHAIWRKTYEDSETCRPETETPPRIG